MQQYSFAMCVAVFVCMFAARVISAGLVDDNPACYRWITGPNGAIYKNDLCKGGHCACSCDDECRQTMVFAQKQIRIRDCCDAVGVKPQCMPLCRYDIKPSDILCRASECYDDLKKWMYCAADSVNTAPNQQCCAQSGVSSACNIFCQGSAPELSALLSATYAQCLPKANTILQCHADHLPAVPHYIGDTQQHFQTEPATEEQKRMLLGIAKTCDRTPFNK